LTGERAHYELAAGRLTEARRLLSAMEASASDGGLLPEQIWDSDDIAERELFLGRPSGSAMPLAWAHAEHIKLLRSLRDGAVFDMPAPTKTRYIDGKPPPAPQSWRFTSKITKIGSGRTLRLELLQPARVRWSADNWTTIHDSMTEASGLGTYICDLPSGELRGAAAMQFTFFWVETNTWQGANFAVEIAAP
jgi:glucoamylase